MDPNQRYDSRNSFVGNAKNFFELVEKNQQKRRDSMDPLKAKEILQQERRSSKSLLKVSSKEINEEDKQTKEKTERIFQKQLSDPLKPFKIKEIKEKPSQIEEIKKGEEIEAQPKLSNEAQKSLEQLNENFIKNIQLKNKDRDFNYKKIYEILQKIARTVGELDDQNNYKLAIKNDELAVKKRSPFEKEEKFGTSTSSQEALSYVISGVKEALIKGIKQVEMDGKLVSIDDILTRVLKSQSRFVLEKNPEIKKSFNDVIDLIAEDVAQLQENLKELPVPLIWKNDENEKIIGAWQAKLESEKKEEWKDLEYKETYRTMLKEQGREKMEHEIGMQVKKEKSELSGIAIQKAKKERENQLNHIRYAMPISDTLLENVLSRKLSSLGSDKEKAAYKINFPILTNAALINGLYYFNMTPESLVKDMTLLMKDPDTPLQIKNNLFELFENLLNHSYYIQEIISPSFKDAVLNFTQAAKENFKGEELDTILKQTNKDVDQLYKNKLDELKDLEIKKTIVEEKKISKDFLYDIKNAIIKGNENEIQELAQSLAETLPLVYAPYFMRFLYQDFFKDPINFSSELAKESDSILNPLKDMQYAKDITKEITPKEFKKNYQLFIESMIKRSYKIGDFLTTPTLLAIVDNKPKDIVKTFSRDRNFLIYRNLENEMEGKLPMIPMMSLFITGMTFGLDSQAGKAPYQKVDFLKSSNEKLGRFRDSAELYLK